jgi:hypothetical protein
MKEKVAVATVQGKAYFLIVNALKEQRISFVSVIPGDPIFSRVKLIITTEEEESLLKNERIIVFNGEEDLERLVGDVKRILIGKEELENVVIGVDPGEAIGLAILGDGKVMEEENCFSVHELSNAIVRAIKNVNFSRTCVAVKIGNGTPMYREILDELDEDLPGQINFEIVGESGTNRAQRIHTRKDRHISSAKRIAGRSGTVFLRRKIVAGERSADLE